MPWLDLNTKIEDTYSFITECENNSKKGNSLNLGIYYQDIFVGGLGFNVIKQSNNSAEIGYMLGKEWNGKGIITKSCKALIHYGFNNLNLNKVTIKAAIKNLKSRAIPEKLGFKQEGVLLDDELLYGVYLDTAIYGMLKRDWKAMPEMQIKSGIA